MKKLLAALLFLIATSAFAGSATLSWDYLASDITTYGVTNFSLERKASACATAGTFTVVATPAATLRTVSDPNLTNGATYCWRLAAIGPGGASAYSNAVEKLIPFPVPPAPGNVKVVIEITLNPTTGQYEMHLAQTGTP